MAKSVYQPKKPVSVEGVEKIISQCYPGVQEHVDELAARLLENAKRRAEENEHACFLSPAGARAVVLAMVVATDGEILR